ncbi:hypothetical protein V7169_13965, partial [Priestia megaterium]
MRGGSFIRDNNVLQIPLHNQIKFITKAVTSKIENDKKYALIAVKNQTTNVSIIHPISDFIIRNWKHSLFNTQKRQANNTVKFLNFLYSQNSTYTVNSLEDLTIEHG